MRGRLTVVTIAGSTKHEELSGRGVVAFCGWGITSNGVIVPIDCL